MLKKIRKCIIITSFLFCLPMVGFFAGIVGMLDGFVDMIRYATTSDFRNIKPANLAIAVLMAFVMYVLVGYCYRGV